MSEREARSSDQSIGQSSGRLADYPREPLGERSSLKPAVWKIAGPDGPLVMKDVSALPGLTRWVGRYLLRRERHALERVQGLDMVPVLVDGAGPDALAYRWLEGQRPEAGDIAAKGRLVSEELAAILAQFHERHVYHLDLHRKNNLVLGPDGALSVIDFGAALTPGPVANALFGRLLAWVDHQAPLKYLARYCPDELTVEEARAVCRRHWLRRLWIFTSSSTDLEYRAARDRLARST